jgi:hypothetical protein
MRNNEAVVKVIALLSAYYEGEKERGGKRPSSYH